MDTKAMIKALKYARERLNNIEPENLISESDDNARVDDAIMNINNVLGELEKPKKAR